MTVPITPVSPPGSSAGPPAPKQTNGGVSGLVIGAVLIAAVILLAVFLK